MSNVTTIDPLHDRAAELMLAQACDDAPIYAVKGSPLDLKIHELGFDAFNITYVDPHDSRLNRQSRRTARQREV